MKSMRNLINLVEDFSSYRAPESHVRNRVLNNARVLQSNIKHLGVNPALQSRLNASIATVVDYLEEV